MDRLLRTRPEVVTLPVRPGVEPCGRPPVRIFLGSEASQFRPERVLVWSVEEVRDPSRVYEIHLMKEIAGFERRRWTTGFTNYRFAIPHWAGRTGRAIYNDEDQIYLTDPAELFDLDMDGHGFLAISERESSVMLIDCERMAEVWPLEDAQRRSKKALLRRALAVPGLFGRIDPAWNARDEEYRAGSSHLLHYTTLHTQPWRPFPERFVYQDNPLAYLWHDLERHADEAGFQLHSRERASARFALLRDDASLRARVAPEADASAELEGRVAGLARASGATQVLHCDPFSGPPASCDGLVCARGLEALPEDDLPWLLDELFGAARSFVLLAVRAAPPPADAFAPRIFTDPGRWQAHLEAASRRHPQVHWELLLADALAGPRELRGGRFLSDGPPRVWILAREREGGLAEAQALASLLGWPFERRGPAQLAPPWPDLVLSVSPWGAAAARTLRERSRGRSRVVHLGEAGGASPEGLDLVVTPVSAGYFPHPARLVTLGPLPAPLDPERRRAAVEPWRKLFDAAPQPRVALLVGAGGRLGVSEARRLGERVGAEAGAAGGSVFALVAAGDSVRGALEAGLAAGAAQLHVARADLDRDDPAYLAHIALADAFVVTGEAEVALADACASGRPVAIEPVPPRRGPGEALRRAVLALAHAPRANDRGTTRPQQGIELFFSRLLARGRVRPPRDLARLHAELLRRGAARLLSAGPAGPPRGLRELERVADRVRALLGGP
jgi:hypothetical protein